MTKSYINVTRKWLKNKNNKIAKVIDQKYYKYNNFIYKVDGKNVILDYSKEERLVAEWLVKTFGGIVKMVPRINVPEGISTPDYVFKNKKFDLKIINGSSKRTIDDAIKKKKKQADNFIIDISNSKLDIYDIKRQITKIYNDNKRIWINIIIIKYNNNIILIYQRKKRFPPAQ